MKYAFAFGTNVNRDKMEITVYDKNRPLTTPSNSMLKGNEKDDKTAENTR